MVNDLLPECLTPFWYDTGKQGYFDGCIRDETQCRRAYRYTLTQCTRHNICSDSRDYPHTHLKVQLESAVNRSLEKHAFMEGIPYRRYALQRREKFTAVNTTFH